MQAALSFLGLLIAVAIWHAGHPALALVAGFLLVGGAGWMLPIWLVRGLATSRAVQPKGHARLDALLIEWRARFGGSEHPPLDLSRVYLDGFGVRWHSPAQFLDHVTPSAIHQEPDPDVQLFNDMYEDQLAAAIEHAEREAEVTCAVVAISNARIDNHSEKRMGVLLGQLDGELIFIPTEKDDVVQRPDGPTRWGNGTPANPDDEDIDEVWAEVEGWTFLSTDPDVGVGPQYLDGADGFTLWLQEQWPSNRVREE